jgi:hypothetical protein
MLCQLVVALCPTEGTAALLDCGGEITVEQFGQRTNLAPSG